MNFVSVLIILIGAFLILAPVYVLAAAACAIRVMTVEEIILAQ